MAGGDLNLSRRALLGGACVVPVLSAVEGPVLSVVEGPVVGAASPFRHAGIDPASTFSSEAVEEGRWTPDQVRGDEEGKRRAKRWQAALARFHTAEAAMQAGRSASEARFDRLSDSYYTAMRRLLRTPAPDVSALAQKLELAVDEEIFTLTGGDACLTALLRDARRLAAPA
jgi:hypothetical protein